MKGGLARVRRKVLAWYASHARDLPWRGEPDPYRVWVSEVMLQQTRVETAGRRYRAFLDRFPTVQDLAAAPEDEVLACWSGLGYYRRARDLREAARLLVERHDGDFPADPQEARRLPGVGPYTAGAVLSMAHGLAVPAVDGNVRRVLCRVFGIEGDPGRGEARRKVDDIAGLLVEGPEPGAWNQALMDLGAMLCTPRRPSCDRCPLAEGACAAEASGRQEDLPAKTPRKSPEEVRLASAVVVGCRGVLLTRDPEGGIVKGMWEPPWVEIGAGDRNPGRALASALRSTRDLRVSRPAPSGEVRQSVLHRRLRVDVYRFEARGGGPGPGGRWVALRRLESVPLSGLARKVLAAALSRG